jgi:hypothetical protein
VHAHPPCINERSRAKHLGEGGQDADGGLHQRLLFPQRVVEVVGVLVALLVVLFYLLADEGSLKRSCTIGLYAGLPVADRYTSK